MQQRLQCRQTKQHLPISKPISFSWNQWLLVLEITQLNFILYKLNQYEFDRNLSYMRNSWLSTRLTSDAYIEVFGGWTVSKCRWFKWINVSKHIWQNAFSPTLQRLRKAPTVSQNIHNKRTKKTDCNCSQKIRWQ